jgi:hypothetical protein
MQPKTWTPPRPDAAKAAALRRLAMRTAFWSGAIGGSVMIMGITATLIGQ